MKNKFIFDLDDTLIYNHHLYSLAKLEFAKMAMDCLGPRAPDTQSIIGLAEEKDNALISSIGFSPNRFPSSFVAAFEEIATKMKLSNDRLNWGKKMAYQIGEKVFNPQYWPDYLISGAKDTLDFLVAQNDSLCLLTMGDEDVQKRKVDHYGVEKWFGKNIYVVPREKGKVMEELSANQDKSKIWYVGNSMKSDILPALNSGIGAVYIPFEAWKYNAHTGELPNKEELIELDSIEQIISLYPSRFS